MVSADLKTILSLEVPGIVRLAERPMALREVQALAPGAIIELPKRAEDELDLLVNNRRVGVGSAVKVGENFGIKLSAVGSTEVLADAIERRLAERLAAAASAA